MAPGVIPTATLVAAPAMALTGAVQPISAMPLMGKAAEAAPASRLAAEDSAEASTTVEVKVPVEAEAKEAGGIMVLAVVQAAAEIEAASVLKAAAAEAAAAGTTVAAKQTEAEVKAAKAKSKAEAEALLAARHLKYLKEKEAAEVAVIAEVRARMCPVAVAEEQRLDSETLNAAMTARCAVPADDVGRDAMLRAFGLRQCPASGYVGNLVRACVRMRELEAFENYDAFGELRSAKARSTARDATQKEAEKMIFFQEKIRYLTQVHLEVAKGLPREMAKMREDSATARNGRWRDAYDIAIKFLSDLWVDIEATAASKDARTSQGPAEEALPADSAVAATVVSTLPMPAPKTRPRLQAYDSKEERYKAMCKADPSYKARHEAWLLAQWADEDEDYGDDGDGSSCSGGECESDDYTDDDRPDWMKYSRRGC